MCLRRPSVSLSALGPAKQLCRAAQYLGLQADLQVRPLQTALSLTCLQVGTMKRCMQALLTPPARLHRRSCCIFIQRSLRMNTAHLAGYRQLLHLPQPMESAGSPCEQGTQVRSAATSERRTEAIGL